MFAVFVSLFGLASGVTPSPQSSAGDDDDQQELRENPELESAPASAVTKSTAGRNNYSDYPYINLKTNAINLNGADWSRFFDLLHASHDTIVSILHIGDSHIQAEGSTSRTRALIQVRFGTAGRGLLTPFRIAGTNQPLDYKITSSSNFTTAKLMKQPWAVDMGFTGIALQPEDRNFELCVSASPSNGIEPVFSRLRVFSSGKAPTVTLVKTETEQVDFEQINGTGFFDIILSAPQSAVTINLTASLPCTIFGIETAGGTTGVRYSAIGNNGATFSSYNTIGTFGRDISPLRPDLVIISLGSNEAFGKVSDAAMRASIDLMVKNILRANPQAKILLTTPADCQRTVRRRVRVRKRRYRTVKSYQHNENIDRLRRVILAYGRDNRIATYDWYAVAGGDRSSANWLKDNLMSKDRIHLSWKGYSLMGELLYDALISAYTDHTSKNIYKNSDK